MPQDKGRDYSYTQNREISWLRFNERVLEEAEDTSVPLLERLKFVSIFTTNLDEFFMVRVGSLFDISVLAPEQIDNKTGLNAAGQLELVYNFVPKLIKKRDKIFKSLQKELNSQGISDLTANDLSEDERNYIELHFKTQILPVLSPQIVDTRHPFPNLIAKQLYISTYLQDSNQKFMLGIVRIPESMPPFIQMPSNPCRYMRIETLVSMFLDQMYGEFKPLESCVMCVTRNADISFDNEKFEDISSVEYLDNLMKLLKQRSRLGIVRLEISGEVSDAHLKLLINRVGVTKNQVYFSNTPLRMQYTFALTSALPDDISAPLQFYPHTPKQPEDLPTTGLINAVKQRDKLLFFPFESVDPFLKLLSEAASHPEVISIKITIYRLASSSKIAHILSRAAENGKEVTVLMELRARFDEANNISWSRLLEESGCNVSYGIEEFKCHSKLCLITMKNGEGFNYITQVGTGNYNEKTNKMYTDLTYITSRKDIGEDATLFFQNMMIANLHGTYNKLLVAPDGIKSKLISLIEREAEKGENGYICIKANSLTEREVIDKLAFASSQGVEIQLILRGICCLLPGITGKTENIKVTSIVGRFLEHSRIYCFGKGDDVELYISSADLMTRNLLRRVEVACPIYDVNLRNKLLWALSSQLSDNTKASVILPDGTYKRKRNNLVTANSQEYFMENSFPLPVYKPKSWIKKVLNYFSR